MTPRGPIAGLVAAGLLVACATPAARLDRRASRAELELLEVRGSDFHHRIYRRAAGDGTLHVYLEGDGLPWATPRRVAADPHPRRPLAFELMLLDPAPALYLGRPCYQRLRGTDPCHPGLWTGERYSETVVESLEAALRRLLEPLPPLALIGYSGGGVLAMLLAERLETTVAVVTVAANLDVAAWVEHHGYTPLAGSLDPALRSPLPASIRQWHLVAGRDSTVPARVTESVARKQPGAAVVTYPDLDHACCWSDVWRDFLQQLSKPELLPRGRRPPAEK